MDLITAQGIGNALRDAELLADAVMASLSGSQPLDASLAEYHRRRDAASRAMYDFTTNLAALNPPRVADQRLLASLQGRPGEIDRFLGVFAGITPIQRYRSPANILRLLGLRGVAEVAAAALGQSLRRHPPGR
jgi:2-polyprenyl-6-methoxyphenol hydroxylase-like FAD-dependent oxidoreductase